MMAMIITPGVTVQKFLNMTNHYKIIQHCQTRLFFKLSVKLYLYPWNYQGPKLFEMIVTTVRHSLFHENVSKRNQCFCPIVSTAKACLITRDHSTARCTVISADIRGAKAYPRIARVTVSFIISDNSNSHHSVSIKRYIKPLSVAIIL